MWTHSQLYMNSLVTMLVVSLWLPTACSLWTDNYWEVAALTQFFPVNLACILMDYALGTQREMTSLMFSVERMVYTTTFVVDIVTAIMQAREVHRNASADAIYQMSAVGVLSLCALLKIAVMWNTLSKKANLKQ